MLEKQKSREQGKFKIKRTVNIEILIEGSKTKSRVIQKDIRDVDGQYQKTDENIRGATREVPHPINSSSRRKQNKQTKQKKTGKKLTKKNTRKFLNTKKYA